MAGGEAACDAAGTSDFGGAERGPSGYDRAGDGPCLVASGPSLPGGKAAGLGVSGDRLVPTFMMSGDGFDAADW